MALVIKDRVRETSTTTGTGTYTLAGAEVGFQTFSTAIGNGNTTPYHAVFGANWEAGVGTVAAGTLARTLVVASSNGNNPVNWGTADPKQIRCSPYAAILPLLTLAQNWRESQTVYGISQDIALEVRTDGDFTPRFNMRKAAVTGHTARLWQLRIATDGTWTLRDDTASADRLKLDLTGNLLPGANGTQDLGSTAVRFMSIFLDGNVKIAATASAEVHVSCDGDGSIPSLRLQKTGGSSDTNREWKIRVNADGQAAFRDETANADRIIFGIGAAGIKPATDNAVSCGASGERWTTVYAVAGTINTSDAREKRDIQDAELGLAFIQKLRPRRYRWRAGRDEREHYGLIAQEMEEALGGVEFGGIEHDADTDRYGLNYSELVPVLVKANQELATQVTSLEERLATLEIQMAALR